MKNQHVHNRGRMLRTKFETDNRSRKVLVENRHLGDNIDGYKKVKKIYRARSHAFIQCFCRSKAPTWTLSCHQMLTSWWCSWCGMTTCRWILLRWVLRWMNLSSDFVLSWHVWDPQESIGRNNSPMQPWIFFQRGEHDDIGWYKIFLEYIKNIYIRRPAIP